MSCVNNKIPKLYTVWPILTALRPVGWIIHSVTTISAAITISSSFLTELQPLLISSRQCSFFPLVRLSYGLQRALATLTVWQCGSAVTHGSFSQHTLQLTSPCQYCLDLDQNSTLSSFGVALVMAMGLYLNLARATCQTVGHHWHGIIMHITLASIMPKFCLFFCPRPTSALCHILALEFPHEIERHRVSPRLPIPTR